MLKLSTLCLVIFILVSQAACAQGLVQTPFPDDVNKFIARRDLCDHFRGEIPDPTTASSDELKDMVNKTNLYCKGTDKQLMSLKDKYSSNQAVAKKLSTYESSIEGK
jgi:hypothetical protein